MEILQGDRIAAIFASKRESEVEVVEQFLGLLNILMSFPGSTFKSYVNHIINLTLGIYPFVSGKDEFMGVKEAVFQVLYTVLLSHWNSCADKELESIMNAFRHSFEQLSDLPVFKNNLFYLRDLNKRNRLFSKDYFALHCRPHFLHTFLGILFGGMHGILEEDIIAILYELAALDFATFFSQVLRGFLGALPDISSPHKLQLLDQFPQDTDAPSFSRNVQQMVGQLNLACLSLTHASWARIVTSRLLRNKRDFATFANLYWSC